MDDGKDGAVVCDPNTDNKGYSLFPWLLYKESLATHIVVAREVGMGLYGTKVDDSSSMRKCIILPFRK